MTGFCVALLLSLTERRARKVESSLEFNHNLCLRQRHELIFQDQHLGATSRSLLINLPPWPIKVWQSYNSQQTMVSVIGFACYRLAPDYFTLVEDEMEK